MKSHVLITGASGFVGQHLVSACRNASISFRSAVRQRPSSQTGDELLSVGSIDGSTDWQSALQGTDVVIHIAARAHVMNDDCSDPVAEYCRVNTEGTLNLASQAASAGVNRFIFISTIKVNGETTHDGVPFSELQSAEVSDPYAISKKQAEDGLRRIALKTGMDVVIIRPPLVYGANVKANFLSLVKLADTALPLPFASIDNKRSFVYVENLVDFIIKCVEHPAAANQTFLISDGEDMSLPELILYMRSALGRPHRLMPFPPALFRILGKLTGKTEVIDRLIGDLQVDSSKAQSLIGWQPPYTAQQAIDATVAFYNSGKK